MYLCLMILKTKKAMKAITIIAGVIFSLSSTMLFSSNPGVPVEPLSATSAPFTILAPTTPSEATFEDLISVEAELLDLNALAPETPEAADFSEFVISLAPVAPKEADFE